MRNPIATRHPRVLPMALLFCSIPALAQKIPFDLRSFPDSPIAFVGAGPGIFRDGTGRRMFFTIKNESEKAVVGLVFEQDISSSDTKEILTLERISVIVRSGERKRLSVSVEDVWNRIQAAAKSGAAIGKPAISIVVVEFVEGGLWHAPLDGRE